MTTKRAFDFVVSLLVITLLLPFLFVFFILASIDTKSSGLFLQKRVGQHAQIFTIFKLRTINPKTHQISRFGNFLRRTKIDELPQLFNILIGDMSFVGPRPDISGYYDNLKDEDRKILKLKPGLTSEASIKYAHEELLLSKQKDPIKFNDEVIFPDKVKMNLEYYYKQSFSTDLKIILHTILSFINPKA